jgi:hypothetical protein
MFVPHIFPLSKCPIREGASPVQPKFETFSDVVMAKANKIRASATNPLTVTIDIIYKMIYPNGKQSTVNKSQDGSMYPSSNLAHSALGNKNHYC